MATAASKNGKASNAKKVEPIAEEAPKTAEAGFKVILNTDPLPLFGEKAEELGVNIYDFRQAFVDAGFSDAWTWEVGEVIPEEAIGKLPEVEKALEASASTRKLEEKKPEPEAKVEAEPEEKPKKKRQRRSGGELTQKKTEAIDKTAENLKTTDTGVTETERQLAVKKGVVEAAELVTLETSAKKSMYSHLKGQQLIADIQQTAHELKERTSSFNPDEYLQQFGIPLAEHTVTNLNQPVGKALEEVNAMVEEIIATTQIDPWI